MDKLLFSEKYKRVTQITLVMCLLLACLMVANSCSDKSVPADEMTEEDIKYHKFASEYLREVFNGKIPLSHSGLDKLKNYIQEQGGDWGRIQLLSEKRSDDPKEIDIIVVDRTTQDLVALFCVKVVKLEMKSGNLKIEKFVWYLK